MTCLESGLAVESAPGGGAVGHVTEVIRNARCGLSPKNELLEAFSIAVARADLLLLADLLSDDVTWLPVGGRPVTGKDKVCRAITRYSPATTLSIDHVVSHGRDGAVDGIAEFGRKRRAFCHVFEFGNAKGTQIAAIRTYSVALA